jgi:hypothetical protein
MEVIIFALFLPFVGLLAVVRGWEVFRGLIE